MEASMAQPIQMLFQGRWTEAWYQLTDEERDQLLTQVEQAGGQAGAKRIALCTSVWANEEFQFFGVTEFPDIAAVQEHAKLLSDLNWHRYTDSKSLLGTSIPGDF
jgi:hypothetical protein